MQPGAGRHNDMGRFLVLGELEGRDGLHGKLRCVALVKAHPYFGAGKIRRLEQACAIQLVGIRARRHDGVALRDLRAVGHTPEQPAGSRIAQHPRRVIEEFAVDIMRGNRLADAVDIGVDSHSLLQSGSCCLNTVCRMKFRPGLWGGGAGRPFTSLSAYRYQYCPKMRLGTSRTIAGSRISTNVTSVTAIRKGRDSRV